MHREDTDLRNQRFLLQDKRKFYVASKQMHFKALRRYKYCHYILGGLGSICSMVASFLSGVTIYAHLDAISLSTLLFSLTATLVAGLLAFSNTNTKILKHFDAYLKFDELASRVDFFLLNERFEKKEAFDFIARINDTEHLVKEYETIGCCFGQIMQYKIEDKAEYSQIHIVPETHISVVTETELKPPANEMVYASTPGTRKPKLTLEEEWIQASQQERPPITSLSKTLKQIATNRKNEGERDYVTSSV